MLVDFSICPSAPLSNIVGVLSNSATFVVMTSQSGGSGSGLPLGGCLALSENPGCLPVLRNIACQQRLNHLQTVVVIGVAVLVVGMVGAFVA